MMNRSSRKYLTYGLVFFIAGVICLLGYAVTEGLQSSDKADQDLVYVSYEVLTDNVMPVINQETQENQEITKPYTAENVEIGKKYYDYKGEEESQQESIIYYENAYIQNTGVDYTSKEIFDVIAIADGKVISVTQDDVVGQTIKIEHSNNLISVYQSTKDAKVKEQDQVTKGQVIATSGTNSIGSDLGNHLHFELYKDNVLVNPEEFFGNNQGN